MSDVSIGDAIQIDELSLPPESQWRGFLPDGFLMQAARSWRFSDDVWSSGGLTDVDGLSDRGTWIATRRFRDSLHDSGTVRVCMLLRALSRARLSCTCPLLSMDVACDTAGFCCTDASRATLSLSPLRRVAGPCAMPSCRGEIPQGVVTRLMPSSKMRDICSAPREGRHPGDSPRVVGDWHPSQVHRMTLAGHSPTVKMHAISCCVFLRVDTLELFVISFSFSVQFGLLRAINPARR